MNPFINPFRERLAQNGVPVGTWLMSGAPSTAEAMGCAGFDWVVVDMEHVPIDYKDAYHLLQAIAGTPAMPVVRLAWNDNVLVKRALDIGAQTLMFPFVQNAADAKRAVAATRYPVDGDIQAGQRGFAAMHRASRYATAADYGKNANAGIFRMIQIETGEAMARLEEIAGVDGVDSLFLGPGDLSASLGQIGNIAHPVVQDAMADAVRRSHAAGKPIGTVGPTPAMVKSFLDMGYDYVAIASDMGMLMRQANQFLSELRPALAKAVSSGVY